MIDIVIPAYAGGQLLAQAMRSVLAQTSDDWRLRVLDDASLDPGMDGLVTGFDDPRISYSRNDENRGINAQFNAALHAGDNDYVVIMGEDDEMLPAYVAQVSTVLARFPEAAIVQPGVQVIDGAGNQVTPIGDRVKRLLAHRPTEPTPYGGEPLMASLLRGNWCYFPSLCWRRDAVRDLGFPREYDVVQDLALLVEVLRRGHQMVVDPRPAFRYRRHGSSLSSERAVDGRRFLEEASYFRDVARSLEADGMHVAARAARWHLTSRLHALLRIPDALRSRDPAAVRTLVRHVAR